jgi:NAD(P)-dependent dehydrogenase (short-subunit alcohol dehydrogenase family)
MVMDGQNPQRTPEAGPRGGLAIDLGGKRALVTGGSSGIGESIVRTLAAAGADVAINYRSSPEAAQSIAKEIAVGGTRALPVAADISDAAQVASMFNAVDNAWGGLDILVNNAGVDGDRQLAWQADLDSWRKVVEINLFGAFYCAREALARMVPQKSGVIVNISSVHEVIPWGGYSAYTSSKAAIGMLTKTLAQEAAEHGVRVLAVAPGAIQTPINKSVWSDPAGLADLNAKIPLGRMGQRDEIARMVAALVSDVASYVTGTTVFVDGGMTDFADFAHGG